MRVGHTPRRGEDWPVENFGPATLIEIIHLHHFSGRKGMIRLPVELPVQMLDDGMRSPDTSGPLQLEVQTDGWGNPIKAWFA